MTASSSCVRYVCDNTECQRVILVPRPGWTCEDGRIANLCNQCFVSYMLRKFCEVYHREFRGWKPCKVCKKNIHCDCIVSRALYVQLVDGEIECDSCKELDDVLFQKPNHSSELAPLLLTNFERTPEVSPTPIAVSGAAAGHIKRKRKTSRKNGRLIPSMPILTEQELNQVDEASNVKVTTLFHKVLTSSDASPIGRLVLPKKYAEAYFPFIDKPEGKPIVIEDRTGKDWEFNYRFWPNNNSRMYVLQGFHLCIKALKLHAGDTVTFCRLEPKGKLQFTYQKDTKAYSSSEKATSTSLPSRKSTSASPSKRKAITASLSRPKAITGSPSRQKGTSVSSPQRKAKLAKVTSSIGNGVSKDKDKSPIISAARQRKKSNDSISVREVQRHLVPLVHDTTKSFDQTDSTTKSIGYENNPHKLHPSIEEGQELSQFLDDSNAPSIMSLPGDEMSAHKDVRNEISKDKGKSPMISAAKKGKPNASISVVEVQPQVATFVCPKRKCSESSSTSKSTEYENMTREELHVSFEEREELSQPLHDGNAPSIMSLPGVKLSSHKDVPGIVSPSIFAQYFGATLQWAQCKECSKWRKVPSDALIPAGWTCSQNYWDLQRSRCSVKEEVSLDKIKDAYMKEDQEHATSPKKNKTRRRECKSPEKVVEQDALAVIPIAILSETPPSTNKKHPRHRPGCICIVCVQPPSGSKHKSSCECSSCVTMRRRLQAPSHGRKCSTISRRKAQNIPKPAEVSSHEIMVNDDPKGKKRSQNNDPKSNHLVKKPAEIISDDQNTTMSSDSQMKNKRGINLNLSPEPVEDPPESMDPVQETIIRYVQSGNRPI